MPITLPPLSEAVPLIIKAFNEERLQAQLTTSSLRASYSGPCAIGIILSPVEQAQLDRRGYSSIGHLFTDGEATVNNSDDPIDWIKLQRYHDRWLFDRYSIHKLRALNEFVSFLYSLKDKYNAN